MEMVTGFPKSMLQKGKVHRALTPSPEGHRKGARLGLDSFLILLLQNKKYRILREKILNEHKPFTALKTLEGEERRRVGQLCKFKH